MVRIQESEHYVVKLGGSLMEHAQKIGDILRNSGRNITIVPGGGVFADFIRKLELDDESSHWMAVLAMEQYGYYLHSLGIPVTQSPLRQSGVNVLLPYSCLKDEDPLPHSWDITSDTIAAWISDKTKSPLILLKSTGGIYSGGRILDIVSAYGSYPECDPCLIPFVLEKDIFTTIINAKDDILVKKYFKGYDVPGTIIIRSV